MIHSLDEVISAATLHSPPLEYESQWLLKSYQHLQSLSPSISCFELSPEEEGRREGREGRYGGMKVGTEGRREGWQSVRGVKGARAHGWFERYIERF
jgi:hypothetical protein